MTRLQPVKIDRDLDVAQCVRVAEKRRDVADPSKSPGLPRRMMLAEDKFPVLNGWKNGKTAVPAELQAGPGASRRFICSRRNASKVPRASPQTPAKASVNLFRRASPSGRGRDGNDPGLGRGERLLLDGMVKRDRKVSQAPR